LLSLASCELVYLSWLISQNLKGIGTLWRLVRKLAAAVKEHSSRLPEVAMVQSGGSLPIGQNKYELKGIAESINIVTLNSGTRPPMTSPIGENVLRLLGPLTTDPVTGKIWTVSHSGVIYSIDPLPVRGLPS